MSQAASPDPLLLLVAYADGELAPEAIGAIEAQLAASADLRNRLEDVRALQAGLRTHLPAAPRELDHAHRRALLAVVEPLRIQKWRVVRWVAAACLALGMLGLWLTPSINMVREGARKSRSGIIEQLGQSSDEADQAPTRVNAMSPTSGGMAFGSAAPASSFMAIGAGGGGVPVAADHGHAERADAESLVAAVDSEKESAEQPELDVREEAVAGDDKVAGVWLNKDRKPLSGKQTMAAPRPPAGVVSNERDTLSVLEKKTDGRQYAAAQKSPASPALVPPPSQTVPSAVGTVVTNGYMDPAAPEFAAKAKPADQPTSQAQRAQQEGLKQVDGMSPAKPVPLEDAAVGGKALLQAVRAKGWQVQPQSDSLVVATTTDRHPLDPTATFGLAKTDFAKAFGTVPMTATADTATLTFAFTADTASFDRARSQLRSGQAVDPAAIRAEHFVNAVPADYPAASGPEAFTLYAEAGPSPFAAGSLAPRTALVSVGAVARPAGADERRPLTLTLAIDCSGSMAQPGGLDRVRAGLAELLAQLGDDDSVAVVAFGDRARVVLPATPGAERQRIAAAVAALQPAGSTNAGEGLSLAYQLAAESAKPGRESRVLFATDGATLAGDGAAPLLERIAADRARGITLIVVGCGGQQYQGAALDALAAKGDGQHVYVGSDDEARALFRDKLVPAKLGVLARDAKVQVTWNPQRVTHARLIGFETRRLTAKDFRNDAVDAGEIAHDTQATALFEVVLADGGSGPLGSAAVRYLDTRLGTVRELACPLPGALVQSHASQRLRLMACSATLADLLGRTWWANQRCATYAGLLAELSRCAPSSFRDDLRQMAEQAQRVTGEP